jgi:hypothetical protein
MELVSKADGRTEYTSARQGIARQILGTGTKATVKGGRHITAISVLNRFFGSLTTANGAC